MVLDALEKQRLRKKMALRMSAFLGNSRELVCVSGHWYPSPQFCELSQTSEDNEMMVVKNRAGKKMKISVTSLRDMIRFQVVEAKDFERWLEKLPALKLESLKREESALKEREEERRRLEKKVIVRKRTTV